ncbi:MAG: hypothetical protein O3B01_32520 [Planctomycetota bacterium]|nr:hypothetical protein [Planctomycetota bacterium]MDA1143305.1 hypothetical protein [Planctomycetota bacterium]
MNIARGKAERNLPKKGFRKDKSGDHIYFYHEYGGVETGPYTKVSHSKKMTVIEDNILGKMRKQLRLDNRQQVVDLIECRLKEDDYNAFLKSKGIIR